jgi:predicted metal-dependent TIM-barrel fold hydrolase
VKIIDPHIHMFSRTTDDYERMSLSGIVAVVEPAFWLGSDRKHPESFLDYFEHLCTFEHNRAARFGIKHFCTVGINPKEARNPAAMPAVKMMGEYLRRENVVAIGEIGLDLNTPAEEEVLRAQLEIAEKNKMPVVIHSPHTNKPKGVERICRIVEDMKVTRERIVIDHNTEETIEMSRAVGTWCGHTIYPTKLSPERAVAILQKYGTDRMLINSSADWAESDPLSVPKAVRVMRKVGFTEDQVRNVVLDNPVAFYSHSPAFKI